jgi:hypothetical protein
MTFTTNVHMTSNKGHRHKSHSIHDKLEATKPCHKMTYTWTIKKAHGKKHNTTKLTPHFPTMF